MIWERLYSTSSSNDWGSLFQLKQLVNRTSFGKEPKHNMKATEDFLCVVLFSHIIAAADVCMDQLSSDNCNEIAKVLVKQFVKINLQEQETSTGPGDSVYAYATDLLSTCLLWHGFHDAIREGDGERIMTYWKFMMVVFRKEKHYNYSNEGLKLMVQSRILSPRKLMELKWSRSVNTQGRPGKNIPLDLHMEHFNRKLKMMIRNLGSNITPKAVHRAAKAFGIVNQVCCQFKRDSDVSNNKPYHSMPSFNKDLEKIVDQLKKDEVFVVKPDRQHSTYQDHIPLLQDLNWKNLTEWVKEKLIDMDFQ